MKALVEVICPTYDNLAQLLQMLNSFNASIQTPLAERVHYTVINNGKTPLKDYIQDSDRITVIEPGKNTGWEGGLKLGLEKSDAPFVMFATRIASDVCILSKCLEMRFNPRFASMRLVPSSAQ